MRILGIDPGTHIVGYGVLDCLPTGYQVVAYGTLQAPPKTPIIECLQTIFDDLQELIKLYQPNILSIEQLFFFRNVTTVMGVSQARGVILLAAARQGLEIAEYTPGQLKMSLTGSGKATKKEVQAMVKEILALDRIPKPDDAADALAIAITHAQYSGLC